ncbi:unhealthy ribosome biogenesis protein 2 homolog [Channa argus]|uniref:unhealthy ribosome biogenesis protein 2 homolog n=1 Tax=Channa argus TaxID=215402 RepID=UPI0029472E66|nr:hypothetical protein Q8A73_002534 [Channa argus]
MAAIYSGIHLKLKSPQTPWEDKLKLARFAWISSQCLLPNKEQVLLDWCTHALTGWYNQKVEFSHDVLEGLWCYLDDLLHSRRLHSLLRQGKSISLRLSMAQLLLDRLQENAQVDSKSSVCLSTILSVCQGVLFSPVLSSVFTTKYELMVDLLAKICSLSSSVLQRPSLTGPVMTESVRCQDEMMTECLQPEPVFNLDTSPDHPVLDPYQSSSKPVEKHKSSNLFEVLLQVLSCYLSVQRQQANPNRVITVVTNQLIQPLVLLRHLLTSGEFGPSQTHLRQQLCKDIRVKIDSILQLAFFPPEHLTSYKEELLPSKEDSGKRNSGGTKGQLKPVSAILSKLSAEGYCEVPLKYPVKSNTLSLLFKFFLESYGKGTGEREEEQRILCFYFLIRLVPALDLNINEHSVSPAKADQSVSVSPGQHCFPQSWSLALLSLEALLSQALAADIYNVAADRIRHGEVQLSFYRALAQMLFNEAQPSIPAWYRCLKVLLSLNHLILEPDLDQLLSSAWVNSECMEARVQKARQLMVCSLFQTYTKLRQLPRLLSELLSVICQPALEELRPPLLSEGVSTCLRTCLLDTPPFQGLEICSLVLESVRKYILPDLVAIAGGGEDEKGGVKVDQDSSLKLFSLSQLLHAVLFSLKTLDNASPLPLVRRTQSLMEEMQQLVKDLLQVLSIAKESIKTNISSFQKTPKKGRRNLSLREPEKSKIRVLWQQKTQDAALLLRYTCVEVDTCFAIHCSKYTSLDTSQIPPESQYKDQALLNAQALSYIHSLVSADILPVNLHPSPSCSPMSSLLLKCLTLQQMKKVLLDGTLLSESSTAAWLNKAAQSIVAQSALEGSLYGEQVWDGQICSVNANSYRVAHWHLVTINLPLIAPYLSKEDTRCISDLLVSSLLTRQTEKEKDRPLCLTVSLISTQLLQSRIFDELTSLFSATVCSLTRRINGVLVEAHATKSFPVLLKSQEKDLDDNLPLSTLGDKEAIVEDILESSKTGKVFVLLSSAQTNELVNLLQILTDLNPDAMTSEQLSSIFLLLLFMLTSTSSQSNPEAEDRSYSGAGAVFQNKLLGILTCLLESKNFQSVLKLIHGGTLLQAVTSSLLWHNNSGRFRTMCSPDWLDLIKAVRGFIGSLVQLIINRNSSVRLNLDQFASFLTSKEITSRQIIAASSAAVTGKPDSGASIRSIHLLLASLTSFSQAMTSNLGKSKQIDQTLTQMLRRTTESLGPTVELVLRPQTVNELVVQPASILGQAFMVEVVTVMLHCELSSLSVENENKLVLSHMVLYQVYCKQILREMSSAPRPMDFLVSSLNFLSAFYEAAEKTRGDKDEKVGNELDELYVQILQSVNRLLTASWLSSNDVSELESPLQELLCHLVEKSTTGRFNLLLLMVKEGLDVCKLRAGNFREVLSTVTIIRLLSSCRLPDPCSKALWFSAPQIISAMVFLVRSSSQDSSLTRPFTIPTVMSLTSLLRQGEGLLTNPHHVILALGALHSVPLDHLTPLVYQSAFLAVHEGLFAIIQCHPQVTLNAAPSFLNVFYRLVASVMQEGRQRAHSDTGMESDAYLQCSRLIERMYSHIAATADSFTTQSTLMVAQYVTELQKVTLRPDIKLHLTEGIFRILDLCMERDIKFLMATLPMGVREVFNELYGSYTHYHKAQRQGEDKYTV